jgi:pyrimidine operon attenuation protein/uracil phosphoribosyltransferase
MAEQEVREDRIEILSADELRKTVTRLASQVLESVQTVESLVLLGIPTRGVQLAGVIASSLKDQSGQAVATGTLDPTFPRDDLGRVGVRMVQATDLPVSVEGRDVVLVDDVVFTGRTVRAALEAIQAWGRPRRVSLLVMVDRGHRELPIQPDFFGRVVPTRRSESIELRLLGLDGEEGVFLRRSNENIPE